MIKGRLKLFQTALVIGEGYFNASSSFPCIPPKPPVAHDQNMVACFGIFHDFGNKGIEVFADMQLAAQRREGFGDIPVHAAGVAEHLVGIFEAFGQGGFHGAEFHGVGTRLEDGEDACVTDTLA